MNRHAISGLALACLLSLGHTAPAAAQWSLEGRVGSALPAGELTQTPSPNQTAGFSFAADAMYTFATNWTGYGGIARQSFNCDGCTTDVTSMGFNGGLKYLFSATGPARPWVRGGLLLNRAAVDGDDRDWGLGVDSGLGIDWLVNPRVAVVPAVRLNSYNSGSLSLTYVTMDLGVHLHLQR